MSSATISPVVHPIDEMLPLSRLFIHSRAVATSSVVAELRPSPDSPTSFVRSLMLGCG